MRLMLEKYSSKEYASVAGSVGHGKNVDTDGHSEDHNNNLVILAFPTNDFHQEPGTNEEIESKAKELLGEQYDNPNFILFHKSTLQHNPVYKALRLHMPEHKVKHNFFKYLIGRDGVPVAFYNKKQTLLEMEDAIKEELETII